MAASTKASISSVGTGSSLPSSPHQVGLNSYLLYGTGQATFHLWTCLVLCEQGDRMVNYSTELPGQSIVVIKTEAQLPWVGFFWCASLCIELAMSIDCFLQPTVAPPAEATSYIMEGEAKTLRGSVICTMSNSQGSGPNRTLKKNILIDKYRTLFKIDILINWLYRTPF